MAATNDHGRSYLAIYSKEAGGDFRTTPEGQHQAVCVDVVDKGLQQTNWGKKPQIQVRWEVEVIDEEADPPRPFLVVATYTNSLSSLASLRHDLVSWRGREFTQDELTGEDDRGFDLEKLIGANCILQIVHKPTRKGGTFAKISAIMGLRKGAAKIAVSEHYERVKDREELGDPPPKDAPPADDDDETPF